MLELFLEDSRNFHIIIVRKKFRLFTIKKSFENTGFEALLSLFKNTFDIRRDEKNVSRPLKNVGKHTHDIVFELGKFYFLLSIGRTDII